MDYSLSDNEDEETPTRNKAEKTYFSEEDDCPYDDLRRWILKSGLPQQNIKILFKLLNRHRGIKLPTDFLTLNRNVLKAMNDHQVSTDHLQTARTSRNGLNKSQTEKEADSELFDRLTQMEKQNQLLEENLSRSIGKESIAIEAIDIFPITKTNSAQVFKRLSQDPKFREKLKKKFTFDSLSMKSFKDREKCIKQYFDDEFMRQYNWDSRKGKKAFKDEDIFTLIFECWKRSSFGFADWEDFLKQYNRKMIQRIAVYQYRKRQSLKIS